MTVRCRGERFSVVEAIAVGRTSTTRLVNLTLRALEGESRGNEITVLYPIDQVEPDVVPELSLEKPGRLARFRLLHDAFKIRAAPPSDVLVSGNRSRLIFEPYQYVPAIRALRLPRPRLLIADDTGIGKTIESAQILQELSARRRANRILIVTPASITDQWQEELLTKFGLRFVVFDSDAIYQTKKSIEIGSNPWCVQPRIITSVDFVKRREGAFRELSASRWDVVIVDEAHHLAISHSADDVTDRHRLGRWLSDATDALFLLTATPHDGYDESFISLLELVEPSLVPSDRQIQFEDYRPYLVRRLKGHIKKEDGTRKFVQRVVDPIPVALTEKEMELHAAVMDQARILDEIASQVKSKQDAEAIRLVSIVLRKRAASSRAALACTLEVREKNLDEQIEDLEIQRDHLRALRKGEAIPEDAQARLERDIHKGYLSVMRKLGSKVRRAEDERAAINGLKALLERCSEEPESKMNRLVKKMREIRAEHPDDTVIVFTEYIDTAEAITAALQSEDDFADNWKLLHSEVPKAERKSTLHDFSNGEIALLVTTDIAGEGLNLQEHCHRIIHFELPWNPNRLEQRNGRVDRYGQTVEPVIGFLYASDTYEGEVLALLVEKIERQMQRLGSVADILGRLQMQRIEDIISRAPEALAKAVKEAAQEIDREIEQAQERSLVGLLGDGTVDDTELNDAKEAAEKGQLHDVDATDFVCRAVLASGGSFEQTDGKIRIVTPRNWVSDTVNGHYLVCAGEGDLEEEEDSSFIDPDHPLLKAAIRWGKASRFSATDDHRLAYVLVEGLQEPDLVATYLVSILDDVGIAEERMEAVDVKSNLEFSKDPDADLRLLEGESHGNVDTDVLVRLFEPWFESARDIACEEAGRRAANWRQALISKRGGVVTTVRDELDKWYGGSKNAIQGEQERLHPTLFGESIPPATRRKLHQLDERYRERRDYLDRRLRLNEPVLEPLGVLLRVPLTEAVGVSTSESGP
jgi:superfamily II DNA or RNA helicase